MSTEFAIFNALAIYCGVVSAIYNLKTMGGGHTAGVVSYVMDRDTIRFVW